MQFWGVVILSCLFVFTGCAKEDSQENKKGATETKEMADNKVASKFKPFYIYQNKGSRANHYIPSGFMPNGKCLAFNDAWVDNCHSGSSCIQIDYDVKCSRADQKWAGIYWLNPANNWGTRKGGYNLTGASYLTFWARGDQGGEYIQEVTVGGVEGKYPDSDKVIFGPIILSKEWKHYKIDLRGKDLSYISGGFSWATDEESVNADDCVFYLDEIRFE